MLLNLPFCTVNIYGDDAFILKDSDGSVVAAGGTQAKYFSGGFCKKTLTETTQKFSQSETMSLQGSVPEDFDVCYGHCVELLK